MNIIFSDTSFFVIDKPSGLVVHGDGRTDEETLVDMLQKDSPELENIGTPHTLDSGRYTKRWGIVNRLDRDTSGLILVARNEKTFENLQKQFLNRTVRKEYLAKVFCKSKPDWETITVDEPISRHKKDPRIWVCGENVGERKTKRDALTEIEFVSHNKENKTGLLRLFPKTGRTHQLRLHTRFLGMPIVGDKKYGINGITNEHSTEQIDSLMKALSSGEGWERVVEIDKNSRLMLHALSLEITHPYTGEEVKIIGEVPKEFLD